MSAQENKQTAIDSYAAFSKGGAEGAMRSMDDSIVWTVRGNHALTGTYENKRSSFACTLRGAEHGALRSSRSQHHRAACHDGARGVDADARHRFAGKLVALMRSVKPLREEVVETRCA